MTTLIIHPKDSSTEFLDIVYTPIPNKTVITGGIEIDEVNKLIESHDRIMMMGHGSPNGLFSVGQFRDYFTFVIGQNTVPLLREKKNSVFIWCNANEYVNRHKLSGFYSGMFISEIGEAKFCGIHGTDQELIDESNLGFCNIISKYINESSDIMYENVIKEYGVIAENNPVAYYNNNRLFLNQ